MIYRCGECGTPCVLSFERLEEGQENVPNYCPFYGLLVGDGENSPVWIKVEE